MKKEEFINKMAEVTIFSTNYPEGESLKCTFPQGKDTEIEIKPIDYKNSKGEDKNMQLAFIPVKIEGGAVESVTVNSTLAYTIGSTEMDKTYLVTARPTKDARFTRLEFGLLED